MNIKLVFSLCYLVYIFNASALASPNMVIYNEIQDEQSDFMRTLKIFSKTLADSEHIEGINTLGDYTANRLQGLGAKIEKVKLSYNNANIIIARFKGKGHKDIMLLCNLDAAIKNTGIPLQDYHIEGDRIYGNGLADGESSTVFALHIVELLDELKLNNYKELTVYINPNLQVGSTGGSRELISKLAAEHDLVLSFGASIGHTETILLGSTGIGRVEMQINGHSAGHITEAKSRKNALVELSHQILQTYDISDSIEGITFNWTIASAGSGLNQIPENAMAQGDLRIKTIEGFNLLEQAFKEKIQKKLVPETTSSIKFDLNRPPLIPSAKSLEMASVAQRIYRELNKSLTIVEDHPVSFDIGFANLSGNAIVLGGLGLVGFNPFAGDGYILNSSITPRLYLSIRLIQEYTKEKPQKRR